MFFVFNRFYVLAVLALTSCAPKNITPSETADKIPKSQSSKAVDPIERRTLSLTNASLTLQKEDGFKPRNNLPAYPLEFPINWAADPFNDENWRFQLNAWRMLDPYMAAWFQTGETAHLEQAVGFVRDWNNFHVKDRQKKIWLV